MPSVSACRLAEVPDGMGCGPHTPKGLPVQRRCEGLCGCCVAWWETASVRPACGKEGYPWFLQHSAIQRRNRPGRQFRQPHIAHAGQDVMLNESAIGLIGRG